MSSRSNTGYNDSIMTIRISDFIAIVPYVRNVISVNNSGVTHYTDIIHLIITRVTYMHRKYETKNKTQTQLDRALLH